MRGKGRVCVMERGKGEGGKALILALVPSVPGGNPDKGGVPEKDHTTLRRLQSRVVSPPSPGLRPLILHLRSWVQE